MIFGIIITSFAIYFNGWIVPKSNQLKFNFERNFLGRNSIPNIIPNLYLQDQKNRIIVINSYDKQQEKAYDISIQPYLNSLIFLP